MRKSVLACALAVPIAAFAGLALFLLAFALLSNFGSPWHDEPGRQLAARIQAVGSPLIEDVVFRPQRMIDPPEVHVIVRDGVTEAEAEQLWCEVVAPAGGSRFEGDLGALILDQSGNWLAADVVCPIR